MKYTQMVCFEIGSRCNLTKQHPLCPSATRSHKGKAITDDLVVSLATEMYETHEFRGFVAFHMYNEPMLQSERIFNVMERIKANILFARFLLWTNGTITPNDKRMALFSQVTCSDYNGRKEELEQYYKKYIPVVNVFSPSFDGRLHDVTTNSKDYVRCLRPLIELIVDNFGQIHICCQDWRGEIFLGNVWDENLTTILDRRRSMLETICGQHMTENAPERCLKCRAKMGASIEPTIFKAGVDYYNEKFV